MNWPAIKSAIHAWIVSGSGLAADHVIWAEQNSARPDAPYISIKLQTLLRQGQDWVDVEDNLFTFPDDDIETVDFANNQLDLTAHGLLTGDGSVRLETTDTLPTGLAVDTDYWIIKIDDDTIQLAATFAEAIAAVPTPVAFSDVGVGTHTLVDTDETTHAGEEINFQARGRRVVNLSIQCYGDTGSVAILNDVISAIRRPSIHAGLKTAGIGIAIFTPISPISGNLGLTEFEPRAVTNAVFFLAQESTETGTYIERIEDPEGEYTP